MSNAFFEVPVAINEEVYSYAPGSPECAGLKQTLNAMKSEMANVCMVINGKHVETGVLEELRPPHEHQHVLGALSQGKYRSHQGCR